MANQYTTKTNMLWIQPDGPGTSIFPLDCTDLDELKEVENAIALLQCWNSDRSGWTTIGNTTAPSESIKFTLTLPEYIARSMLETVNCPFTLYWTQTQCGRVDDFGNAERGEIVQHVQRTGRAYNAVAHRKDDKETNLAIDVEAWPKLLDIDSLEVSRQPVPATTVTSYNDIIGNNDLRCTDDCGNTVDPGELGLAVADAAAGAFVDYSTNFGATWTTTAAVPGWGAFNAMACTRFSAGGNTVRWLAGQEGLAAAAQGVIAYSDNGGVSWTSAPIGGAAAGHGPTWGHGLFALDRYHVWCACNLGFIYKSIDGGQTWVAKESGVIHAGLNHFVNFADKIYGIVGGAAGVTSMSDDGGESWSAGGIPFASAAYSGWRFNKNKAMVGLANGSLYYTNNASAGPGAVVWTLYTPAFPANIGIRSMWFVDEYRGFLVLNVAGPIGKVYRTVNGGATWEYLVTPANNGLNSVWAANGRLAYAAGEIGAAPATGVILKVQAAYV